MSKKLKLIELQNYRSEFNLKGEIFQAFRDPEKENRPFLLIPEELEPYLRAQLEPPIETIDLPEELRNDDPDTRTLKLNVSESVLLINKIESVTELLKLREGEQSHPEYRQNGGGRRGVLDAIDQRVTKLTQK